MGTYKKLFFSAQFIVLAGLTSVSLQAMDDREVVNSKPQKSLTTKLYSAAYSGNIPVLARALQDNPGLVHATRREQNNNTLLHAAALGNQAQAIRLLIDHNAEVDARNTDGQTPLALAALTANTNDSIRALIDAGANVDNVDRYGRTPLMAAVVKGLYEAVRLLVHANTDINHTTKDGSTALDMALDSKNEKIISYLQRYEAAAYRRNRSKERRPLRVGSPVHKKQKQESQKSKENKENSSLASNSNTVSTEERTVVVQTPVEPTRTYAAVVAPAIETQDPTVQEPRESTRVVDEVLHAAAERGDRARVEQALQFGADVNGLLRGQTPLHRASYGGHAAIVELLLNHGALIDIANAQGLTPAQVARNYRVMHLFIEACRRNQQASSSFFEFSGSSR